MYGNRSNLAWSLVRIASQSKQALFLHSNQLSVIYLVNLPKARKICWNIFLGALDMPDLEYAGIIKISALYNAFLVFWLLHSISVIISSYTLVCPYMGKNYAKCCQAKISGRKQIIYFL